MVFSHKKEHILNLANFIQYTSAGRLVGDNGTKIIGHDTVSINTIAIPRIPHFGDGGYTEFIVAYHTKIISKAKSSLNTK